MHIVFVSPPAAGRASNRVRIKERYPLLCYANPNELLRTEIQTKSPFGIAAQNNMMSGTPISDNEMMDLVLKYLKSPTCNMGFILEGLPKSAEQAERLVEEMKRVDAVVELEVSDQEVLRRTSGRMIHRTSGRIYHDVYAPPRRTGYDDLTNEPLTRRLDDERSVAEERLKQYRAGVISVKRYFTGLDPYPERTQQYEQQVNDAAVASQKAAASTSSSSTTNDEETKATTTATMPEAPHEFKFPNRPPVMKVVDGNGAIEEVRTRLFSTLDRLVGKRATGPHQQRWWWQLFS